MTLCDRATYVHLGRKAATILAPSTPILFEARLRLVMAPLPLMASVRAVTPAEKERMHKIYLKMRRPNTCSPPRPPLNQGVYIP
jgi:hypothetical protein